MTLASTPSVHRASSAAGWMLVGLALLTASCRRDPTDVKDSGEIGHDTATLVADSGDTDADTDSDTDTDTDSDTDTDTDTTATDTAPVDDPYITTSTTTTLTVPNTEAENLGSSFTLEARVRVTRGARNAGQVLVGKHRCNQLEGWWLGLVENRPALYTGEVWITAPTAVDDDTWHHLAGTYSGVTARLYMDGVEVQSGRLQRGRSSPEVWYLGDACGLGFGANADIDDVAIWSGERTAAEVATDATTNPTGSEANLEAYFPLDEGSGQTTTDRSPAAWSGVLGRSTAVEGADAVWGP